MAFQVGNSVRLSVTYRGYDGAAANPDVGTERLTMYGASLAELLWVVPAASIASDGTGIRHFDWVPTTVGSYIYEWYGLIAGEPTIIRRLVAIVEV